MIVTALVENHADHGWPGLRTELGLAIHIDCSHTQILFDAGASDAFIHNAKVLGIDLSGVDSVIVSHGHYDHFNGLAGLFPLNDKATVYLHARAADYYMAVIFGVFKKYIGIDRTLVSHHGDRIETISDAVEIADGIFTLTGLSRKYPLPPDAKILFVKKNGTLVPDRFEHEILLVIREKNGLVVFAGGCHSGILNAVASVREHFPGHVIQALFCGFHAIRLPFLGIMPGGKVDIKTLAGQLNQMEDVKKIYTCHSTSRNVHQEMKQTLGDKLEYFSTGCRVSLG